MEHFFLNKFVRQLVTAGALLLLGAPAFSFNRAIMEGIPATNKTVWVDTTNVSVGFGTSSAPYAVTIYPVGVGVGFQKPSGNWASTLRFGNGSGQTFGIGIAQNGIGGSLYNAGQGEIMTFTDTGFIGINTTTPGSLVDINNGVVTVRGPAGGLSVPGALGIVTSGRLGVGTLTPNSLYSIENIGRQSNDGAPDTRYYSVYTAGPTGIGGFDAYSSTNVGFLLETAGFVNGDMPTANPGDSYLTTFGVNSLIFGTNLVEDARFDATGNFIVSRSSVTNSLVLTYLTPNQCLTSGPLGQVTTAGFACGSGGGGGSGGTALAVTFGVARSSPTSDIIGNPVQFTGTVNGSTMSFVANSSTFTMQGNAFNGVSQLIQTTAAGKYPAIDGSLITNLPSGVSVYPATSTILANQGISGSTFNFTGPAQSTVTFGLTVGSFTETGTNGWQALALEGVQPAAGVAGNDWLYADSTDHQWKMWNNNSSTASVVGSTSPVTVGQCASWTGTGLQGSVPCGSITLAGNNIWTGWENWTSPSVSTFTYGVVMGSFTTTLGQISDYSTALIGNTTALFEIYSQFNFNKLMSIGSKNLADQFYVKDQSPTFGNYGATFGGLNIGFAGTPVYRISTTQDNGNYFEWWNASGQMTMATASSTRDLLFMPNSTEALRVSNTGGVIAKSSTTILNAFAVAAPQTAPFEASFSTSSVGYHVQISTNGHVLSNGASPVISACGSTPNGSVVGNDHHGVITIGGGSVTACTLTFAASYGAGCIVSCTTSDSITTATPDVTATPTTMTLGFSATIGGGSVSYECEGVSSLCH
jgi:hypothetical protein